MIKFFKTKESAAFLNGFASGMSSPYRFLYGAKCRFDVKNTDLVSRSWHGVGRSMKYSLKEVGKSIGETSGNPAKSS